MGLVGTSHNPIIVLTNGDVLLLLLDIAYIALFPIIPASSVAVHIRVIKVYILYLGIVPPGLEHRVLQHCIHGHIVPPRILLLRCEPHILVLLRIIS